MNYQIFDECWKQKAANLEDWAEEKRQEFMERTLKSVCLYDEREKRRSLNDFLKLEYVACSYTAQTLSVRIPILSWELNPGGTLHGGMLASFMDTVCGLLVRFVRRTERVATAQLNTNYLYPAREGETLIVTARVEKSGRRTTFVQAKAYIEKTEELIATMSGIFM